MIFAAIKLSLRKNSARAYIIGASLAAMSACSPPPSTKVLIDTATLSFLDSYKSFSIASQELATATAEYCQSPNNAPQFELARTKWKDAAKQWSSIQNIQFGPLMVDNQAWKIQFWPDKKNLIARKVESLLKENGPITQQRVDEASVVVQGLSSLEYLLFDNKAGTPQRYIDELGQRRCELLVAVSEHLHTVSAELYNNWRIDGGNYLSTFSKTGDKNPEFPDDNVAIAYLLDTLVSGIELIKRDKLERPLGISGTGQETEARPAQTQVYQLEWWRSQYSKDAIITNLIALKGIFNANEGYGIDDYLREVKQQGELSDNINKAFQQSIAAASAIDGSLFEIANKPERRQAILSLHAELTNLLALLRNDLPTVLGVSLGFNSKDGD
ncbi:imelysin family protein [Zhongshania aquimaris]|uniref:Imelysin family protein n=1 Tax=Zhongshania aquimaris TaxID=2857107 RepID=A0ABS6VTJ4_9GAMM|nr:imelysin family protein [Zhongshania aquimaris]MBW2941649.1 imelysin family protein [Zhongshania aquimaris]